MRKKKAYNEKKSQSPTKMQLFIGPYFYVLSLWKDEELIGPDMYVLSLQMSL